MKSLQRLIFAAIAVVAAPFVFKATRACFNHEEVEINAKIMGGSTNPEKLEPPLTGTVCGTDLYFQQEADVAVFTKVAERIAQEEYDRGKQGLAPLSPEEVRTNVVTQFKTEWEAAVKRVTKTPIEPLKVHNFSLKQLGRLK